METKEYRPFHLSFILESNIAFVWEVFRSGVSVGGKRVDVVLIGLRRKKYNNCRQQSP